MAKSNAFKMKLPSVDDLFSTEESRQEVKLKKLYDIPLSEIDDFPDHPYRVVYDEDMKNLMDSIEVRGVITPAMVRKKDDGRYEMISGHRRKYACEHLGLETIRCEVVEVSRDEAIILMVDSNSQRSEIAPCDKGRAYKMKLEAMNRQGMRTDLTFSPLGKKLENGKELAEEVGDSQTQIYRYNVVDRIIETEAFPSHDQAIRIRKAFEEGNIDYYKVQQIMEEEKPNQKPKFKFNFDRLSRLIPSDYTPSMAEDYVVKALEYYQHFLQRQQEQER